MKAQKEMVTKEERATFALFNVVSNFAKADSTLAGRRITTNVVNDTGQDAPPAFTNGNEITFNVSNVPPVTKVDGLVAVNGLNYHELAHCIYTPKSSRMVHSILNDVINDWVQQNQNNNPSNHFPNAVTVHRAFNILEDNRIESLLIDRWSSTKPYLVATFAHYFASQDVKTHEKAWPLCMGRSYLPKQVKSYFKQAFENSAWCKNHPTEYARMQDIMREFKALTAPNTDAWWRKAYELALEYSELYPDLKAAGDPFGNSVDSGKFSGKGDPQSGGADGDGTGEEGDDDADDGDGGSASGAPGADSDGDSEDSDDSSTGGGNGAGHGSGDSGMGTFDKDAQEALRDVVRQQANDSRVKQDVRRQQESMRPGNSSASSLPKARSNNMTVDAPVKASAQKFGKAMRRLVTDADPGFHRGHSSGRVNVQRAMRGEPLDTVFDRWEEGRYDADSIELVVMLDRSGSMAGSMVPVCEAAWQIKHGAESISNNTKVTIIAFDDDSEVLYGDSERSGKTQYRSVGSRGGTDPTTGLVETIRIMHASNRKHKAVIILTDGAWWTPPTSYGAFNASADEIIQRLNVGGVTTACMLMGGAMHQVRGMQANNDPKASELYDSLTHGAQVRGLVSTPEDFATFSNSLVKRMIKN